MNAYMYVSGGGGGGGKNIFCINKVHCIVLYCIVLYVTSLKKKKCA